MKVIVRAESARLAMLRDSLYMYVSDLSLKNNSLNIKPMTKVLYKSGDIGDNSLKVIGWSTQHITTVEASKYLSFF
jgi:hypothetical protein